MGGCDPGAHGYRRGRSPGGTGMNGYRRDLDGCDLGATGSALPDERLPLMATGFHYGVNGCANGADG